MNAGLFLGESRLPTTARPAVFRLATIAIALSGVAVASGAQNVPLSDLGAGDYLGYSGGLYEGGSNTPPADLDLRARQAAAEVVPRDADGAPDPDGAIGLIVLGMSNATQEFRWFTRAFDGWPERNGQLVAVNTAVGGKALESWSRPDDEVWTIAQQRLEAAGLTMEQVQVAWMKLPHGSPDTAEFPAHAEALRDDLFDLEPLLRERFPHLKLVYVSNRIFGGYEPANPLRDEPLTYEIGFGIKWYVALSNQQPPETRPVVLWGPDLWADAQTPRSDGLAWLPEDVEDDGTHPSVAGERKVAALLSDFFRCRAPANSWLRGSDRHAVVVEVEADATLEEAGSDGLGLSEDLDLTSTSGARRDFLLRFELPAIAAGALRSADLNLLSRSEVHGTPRIHVTDGSPWEEASVLWSTAPGVITEAGRFVSSSRDGSVRAEVTPAVSAALASGVLEVRVRATTAALATLWSREGGSGARLTLRVDQGRIFSDPFECGDLRSWTGSP